MKFVAVTACPTGIAHSQMAAESLERVAEANGHEINVEVQGAMGRENELSTESIAAADAVVVAAATSVKRDRFDGKPLVVTSVKDAVNDAEGLLRRAIEASEAGTTSEIDDAGSAAPVSDRDSLETNAFAKRGDERSNGVLDRVKRFLS